MTTTVHPVRLTGSSCAAVAALWVFQALPALADVNLAQCQRWQRSSGLERILLGNAIGAAAYLTKVQRFAVSEPEHPVLLYAPSDLQRTCEGWR